MSTYEIWLESCAKQPNIKVWLLEDSSPYKLFELVELDTELQSSNNYNYFFVNYHIWNTETGEWIVNNNYLTAYNKYKRLLAVKAKV